jgi:hypothetical protein
MALLEGSLLDGRFNCARKDWISLPSDSTLFVRSLARRSVPARSRVQNLLKKVATMIALEPAASIR